MTIYVIVMYLVSLAFGYDLAFTQTTLAIGKSLSDTGTGTGYQDAITPPPFSTFGILVYVVALAGVIYGFWAFGWLTGLAVAIGLVVAARLNMVLILPKINDEHFRRLIIHSMINRHADYLKAGDTLRASVMAELLAKLGVPVAEFVAQMTTTGDA